MEDCVGLIGDETLGHGEAGLPFVEGPEAVGFQFEGGCDVQRVEGADAESGPVSLGRIDTGGKPRIGKWGHDPDAGVAILFEIRVGSLSMGF